MRAYDFFFFFFHYLCKRNLRNQLDHQCSVHLTVHLILGLTFTTLYHLLQHWPGHFARERRAKWKKREEKVTWKEKKKKNQFTRPDANALYIFSFLFFSSFFLTKSIGSCFTWDATSSALDVDSSRVLLLVFFPLARSIEFYCPTEQLSLLAWMIQPEVASETSSILFGEKRWEVDESPLDSLELLLNLHLKLTTLYFFSYFLTNATSIESKVPCEYLGHFLSFSLQSQLAS